MQAPAFTYTTSWPYTFSAPFTNYVNAGIGGQPGYFEHNNVLVPYIFKRKFIFNIVYVLNRPYSIQRQLKPDEERDIMNRFFNFCKIELHAHFVLSTLHLCTYQLPDLPGLKTNNIGIVRVALGGKTEDDVFAGFQGQYRNIIRKAEKEGVVVKTGIDRLDDFYKLYEARLKEKGAPYDPLQKIKILLSDKSLHSQILCSVAYLNDEPDAALLNFTGAGIVYNTYAASKHKPLHKGSLKLLHWYAMQQYIAQGIKYYQLGGVRLDEKNAELDNIVDFKMRFGAEIEHGKHFVYVINTAYYKLYNALMTIRTKI